MQLLQIKTKLWFRPTLETVKYGYITEIRVNSLTVVEETGLSLVTLQWHQQGYIWGKDKNPPQNENDLPSEGWTDGWTYPR